MDTNKQLDALIDLIDTGLHRLNKPFTKGSESDMYYTPNDFSNDQCFTVYKYNDVAGVPLTDICEGIMRCNAVYPDPWIANRASELKQFNDDLLFFKWRYDRDYKPDWVDYDEPKYSIIFDSYECEYLWVWWTHHDYNTVVFSSKEIAIQCADWLNRKYKLGKYREDAE